MSPFALFRRKILQLSDIFQVDQLKFTKHQVNQGLLKSGHVTKEEYDYLEKEDQKDENK